MCTGFAGFANIVAINALALLVPLGLVWKFSDIHEDVKPCNDDGCLYYRYMPSSDGLPATTAAAKPNSIKHIFDTKPVTAVVLVTNGREVQPLDGGAVNGTFQIPLTPNASVSLAAFAAVFPNTKCPGNSTEEMQDLCDRRDVKMMITNNLTGSPAELAFKVAIICWALLRAVHDILCLATKGEAETPALILNMLGAAALSGATCAAFFYAMGATEVFAAHLPEGCACFYVRGTFDSILALAIPLGLWHQSLARLTEMFRAVIGGACLISVKYHIPLRVALSTGADGLRSLGGIQGAGNAQAEPLPERKVSDLVRCHACFVPVASWTGLTVSAGISFAALGIRVWSDTPWRNKVPGATLYFTLGMTGLLMTPVYSTVVLKHHDLLRVAVRQPGKSNEGDTFARMLDRTWLAGVPSRDSFRSNFPELIWAYPGSQESTDYSELENPS